jgi:gamma-glutamyltranspeptidase/glutathione hydrolase
MKTPIRLILGAAAIVSCTSGPATVPPRVAMTFPPTWRFASGDPAVFAPTGMVVTSSELASRVGVEIMQRGGNAVDAAVATGFALAVTFPEAGNIGGGGFMVIRMADGRTESLDYRETAPAAATRDMYIGPDGKVTNKSLIGHLAVGVPGSVAGMLEALRKYGTMPLSDIIAPAIRLAEDGFEIDSVFSRTLGNSDVYPSRFEGARLFYPGGKPLPPGSRLVQSELAWTLRQIAERGDSGFYHGAVADSLVAEIRRGGGIITREDLRGYKPKWREPIRGTYRGYTLISMPPPSSGGITMTEALNVLETYDAPAPFGSTQWAHRFAESYQRAFIDRNATLGDPDFIQIPQERLTSKEYARELRSRIDANRHTATAQLMASTESRRESPHTTHYSVVDRAGNAVATTTTLNNTWGSGVWVRGAGFILNDEMDDFASQPGTPNLYGLVQGEQNAIAPGKRMLSAMTPTIVLDPSGKLLLVVGGAGGPRIITGVSQVILNVIDHRMTLADAMRAPRLHHQSLPDSLRFEKGGLFPAVADSLRAMGHGLQEVASITTINAIARMGGGWHGVPEPRFVRGAVGY